MGFLFRMAIGNLQHDEELRLGGEGRLVVLVLVIDGRGGAMGYGKKYASLAAAFRRHDFFLPENFIREYCRLALISRKKFLCVKTM